MKIIKIVFFGDSICFGQGISIHKGWVPRIAAKLEKLGEEKGIEFLVVNASVNGNTTRMALERMPYEVQSQCFDVVISQFGLNDCNFWETDRGLPRVSPFGFEGNLHEIINRSLCFGAKKVFINTNHPTTRNKKFSYVDKSFEESNKEYNDIIRRVASNYNETVLTDMEQNVNSYCHQNGLEIFQTLLDDQLHLSLLGHDIYFQSIFPVLKEYIENNIHDF